MAVVGGVQDYLLMDPRVRQVDGHAMVNEMRQNIEIMLRKKKHAIQVRSGVLCGDDIHNVRPSVCYYRILNGHREREWSRNNGGINTLLKLALTLHRKQSEATRIIAGAPVGECIM